MAGELKFALMLDDAGNAPAVLERTATAFKNVNNAAGQSANGLDANKAANKKLNETAQGTNASLRALESIFMIFGGQVAPQMTGGILTVTSGMTALKATATATGLALGTIGAAALGAVGILATLSSAVDLARAKLAEGASETSFFETMNLQAEKLRNRVVELFEAGLFGEEEAINLQVQLDKNSADDLQASIKAVIARVREVDPAFNLKAKNEFNSIQERVATDSLSGPERIQAELGISLRDFEKKILPLAETVGASGEEISKILHDFRTNRLNELEKQFGPQGESASGGRSSGGSSRRGESQNLTGLERLGLMISTGAGGGMNANDPARQTATNTQQLVTLTRNLVNVLGKTGIIQVPRV